ncbi:MAG: hypothetical protein M3426_05395 [Actinomycetota bacterium]|jgi:hypothetical protein|nr:hypothetical protein [Actinomycetota bacterium]
MNNARTVLTVAVAGLVLLILLAAFTGSRMMGGMGQMMSGGMMGGGAIGLLFMLLFWGLFIALIVGVVLLISGRR